MRRARRETADIPTLALPRSGPTVGDGSVTLSAWLPKPPSLPPEHSVVQSADTLGNVFRQVVSRLRHRHSHRHAGHYLIPRRVCRTVDDLAQPEDIEQTEPVFVRDVRRRIAHGCAPLGNTGSVILRCQPRGPSPVDPRKARIKFRA